MNDLNIKIHKFAQYILDANNIVALTGAGMGTESGIADFRSPGTGMWEKVNPEEFASIHSYVSNTKKNLDDMKLFVFYTESIKFSHYIISRKFSR